MSDPDPAPVVDERAGVQPLLAFVPALVRCSWCRRVVEPGEEHPLCDDQKIEVSETRASREIDE